MSVGVDAGARGRTSYAASALALPEERSERIAWPTLLFMTVVFYLIDHSFSNSVDISLWETSIAAEKASSVAAGNVKRQVGYMALGLYGIVAWLRPPRFRVTVNGLVGVTLLALLAWTALSLAWSMNPTLTLRRLSALGLMVLGIAGLLRQFSGIGLVRLILFMTLFYLIVGVGAELFLGVFAPWAPGYRFAGTLHPNLQGINCAALVFSALTLAVASKRFRPLLLALAAVGFGFLVLTGSRGALAGGLAGLLALWMLKTRRSVAVMTMSVLGCLGLLGTFLVANGILPSPQKLLLVERTEGVGMLTGRPDLWGILLEYARQRPIQGYGYGGFFDPERGLDMAARIGAWAFGGPHSVYLGVLVDLGIIGLVCLVVVLLGGILKSVRMYRYTVEPHFLFFTAMLVLQITNGITEAQLLTPNPCLIPGLTVAFLAFRSDRSDLNDGKWGRSVHLPRRQLSGAYGTVRLQRDAAT
jgi:exopolysaccharide production protein ExoQ